ncbi:MAG: putative lipid II flippase FtsW [Betaproteobacteria bacterium]|nr:putative lipid II flippase FtsW [Betaproteobacteria bacterium]
MSAGVLQRWWQRMTVRKTLDFSALGPQASRIQPLDHALVAVVVAMLMFGLVFVYSASIALPDHPDNLRMGPNYFLVRHSLAMLFALVVGLVVFQVPVSTLNRYAPWIFVAALVMLMLVLVPFIGKEAKGARRWIQLGFFSFQPTELMKVAAMLYAANYITRKQELKEMFVRGFLPVGFALGLAAGLVFAQKDLGGFAVVVVTAMLVLFYGGISARIFGALTVTFAVAAGLAIVLTSWRMNRVYAFLDPFDPKWERTVAWQLTNSLIAFARGGITGEGLGESVEKLFYLPDAHTDFILAVVGEELGLMGVLSLVLAYWWIVWRAFGIGRQALVLERPFAGLVALGIGTWLGVQTLINMGVALGMLPTKGLTLPFISYGGSAILMAVSMMALLLRIDFENRQVMMGKRV